MSATISLLTTSALHTQLTANLSANLHLYLANEPLNEIEFFMD